MRNEEAVCAHVLIIRHVSGRFIVGLFRIRIGKWP
jgi:hypothetical protein